MTDLLISVECGKEYCGNCEMLEHIDGCHFTDYYCAVFGGDVGRDSGPYTRLLECLEAEKKAEELTCSIK